MLENQVAIVTGGARGIGRAIALALADEGAYVVVNYASSAQRAQEVVREIQEKGGQAEAGPCNVADGAAVEAWFADVLARLGRIDILVNNAGITKDGLLMRMSEEDFTQVLDTNLTGAFHCCKWAVKTMIRKRRGKIVNISSVSGVSGNAGQVNYSASKAGLIGMTKSIAKEVASRGINVNAVAPGFIETDMTEVLPENVKEGAKAQIPLKDFGRPEDVADAVVFLVSEKSRYITGQVLHVDGGMIM